MSDAGHKLYRETEAAKVLLAQMADIIGDDEQLAADTVLGETDLNEAIDLAVQQMVDDKAAVDGLETMIKRLTDRRERIKARMDTMKIALTVAMVQAGRKKFKHGAVTLSVRNVPPSAIITDESALPSKFFKPQDPLLDKRAVLAALKAKEDVPGAALSNGGATLAISWG